ELGSEPYTGHGQFDRRIHFINLPPKCTIRIFTLDGDLVREIKHDKDPDDPTATHETWDLITRNTQAIVSGIYLFSVESDQGDQVGKFVIVK
ncbi:MAG: T9SS type A sorting domain-containing protein, partial [Candidatus Zixiibacteriota bacterium]